jgi:hypothetical protein
MNDSDLTALQSLRKVIAEHNQNVREGRKSESLHIKNYWNQQTIKRVKVSNRRPEKVRQDNRRDSKAKYGFGGNVRADQNPAEADVYVYKVSA